MYDFLPPHLSQVDVDGVLQELGGLPRPLLHGEHPDRLHARLQLDDAGGLILREIRGGGARFMKNEVDEGRLDSCDLVIR